MEYKDIFAVIICYNGSNDLFMTVNALQNKVGHIHIVDNCSSIETLEMLETLGQNKNISIEYLNINQGIGLALNIGVRKGINLGYGWILTMDQDSIVSDTMIDEFCNTINQDYSIVCLTPIISVFGAECTFNIKRKKYNNVEYAITSGNLVKSIVYEKIGFYNEELFIDCVDFDFSLRLRNAGYNIVIVPEAKLFHQLGDQHDLPKFLSRFYTLHSPLRRYYIYRNWGYIINNYFKKYPLLIIKSTIIHVVLLIIILFYDKKRLQSFRFIYYGIKDFFKNQYGPLKIKEK